MRTQFNDTFYRPNTIATLEQAEQRMKEEGYSTFHFKGVSRSNGVSFYFEIEGGQEVRVSDHPLTGRRAFDVIQVPLYKIIKMSDIPEYKERMAKLKKKREKESAEFKARLEEMMKNRKKN